MHRLLELYQMEIVNGDADAKDEAEVTPSEAFYHSMASWLISPSRWAVRLLCAQAGWICAASNVVSRIVPQQDWGRRP